MIRKRVPKLLTILATAACIFGFVLVVPADTPTLSPMPTASADVLANGYDVNCTKVNDLQVLCTVAGCPKVAGDLVGDELHVHINGNAAGGKEVDKACGDTYSETINIDANKPFTYHVQGVRHHDFESDDLTAYSVYEYKPPVQAPVNCPPNSKTLTVVPPAQCEAAPMVKCPEGSPTVEALSLDKCAPIPAKDCPPGSKAATATPPAVCEAPTNAVSMNITQEGLNANVAITNNSALPAECAYTATKTSGLLGPGTVNRNISVGPNATGNITDLLWPAPFVSYRATAKCTATYDGKQVTIGESTQNVQG
jgi:hypothetical protein